jgi:hypothetical protein
LKDHLHETFRELKAWNSNEENKKKVIIQCDVVLECLKIVDGKIVKNVLNSLQSFPDDT